jgi:hypothetical protein
LAMAQHLKLKSHFPVIAKEHEMILHWVIDDSKRVE